MSSSSSAFDLDSLAGLGTAKRAVRSLLAEAEHVHAVLLYGSEGAGKSTLSRILAAGWLCGSADGAPCGECRSCQAFARDASSDLLTIVPHGPSRLIKLAQIVPVKSDENWLPVSEFFRTNPLYARHKVVLIEEADRMNRDSASSLLKMLEEPPPFGKLVLTTHHVGGVLPTILSRCLAIACELPTRREAQALSPALEPDEILLAGGAPGRIRGIERALEWHRSLRKFARGLSARPPGAALVATDAFRELCEEFQERESANARSANAECLQLLAEQLAFCGAPPAWVAAAIEAHRRILGNGNPQLVLDALFAQILSGLAAATRTA